MERTQTSFVLNIFNDQNTRSLLIQTATLILVLLLVYLILQNIAINLASANAIENDEKYRTAPKHLYKSKSQQLIILVLLSLLWLSL